MLRAQASTAVHHGLPRRPGGGVRRVSAAGDGLTRLLPLVAVGGAGVLGVVVGQVLVGDAGARTAIVGAATGSAGAVLAAVTAYLLVRRLHRTLAVADAVLAGAITAMALVFAGGALLAEAPGLEALGGAGSGGLLAAGLLAAAAVGRTAGSVNRADAWYGGTLAAGLLLILAPLAAGAGDQPGVTSAAEALAACLALAACTLFLRDDAWRTDPFRAWLAVAALVLAVSHLSDLVVLWTLDGRPLAGDLAGLAAWVALLVAGARDFEMAYRRQADDAVSDERRRLARELHDGLAQELAYISSETRRMAEHPSGRHLARAAERALEESRTAILALSRPPDEPLERTIAIAARSVGDRAGVDVVVAVRPGLEADPQVRQALLRILREAMTNAVRHGRADAIHVSVDGPSPLVMAVADNGAGFDLAAPRPADSFGLQTMRDRAENLGGGLSVESEPGHGTTVAVVVP